MKEIRKIVGTAKWTNYLSIVVIILLIIFALPARSDGFQSLASIRLQAEAYILQYPYQSPYKPAFEVSRLDDRLRLKSCNEPLAVVFSNPEYYFGNTALEIRCPQKPGWKIHLPARIDLFDDVIVSGKALLKGQLIDDSTIAFEKRNVVRLKNGYFSRNNQLVELQARRNLPRGTVLSPSNLSPRMLVRSGQQVTLILKYKGIQIKSSGQALQSASLGQLVKVRNNQSQKIVEGVVSGDSQVQVRI